MREEINILSIDFDWIMEPSIALYNDLAADSVPCDETLSRAPGVTIKPDFEKFRLLNMYINNIVHTIKDTSHVGYATHHEAIIDYIKNIWKLGDKRYNIYNIDHHHDCGYGVLTMQDIYDMKLQCGNWVPYCDKIKDYIWINNKNSITNTIIPEVRQRFRKFQFTADINIINYVKFDYLFLCLSPGWVPKEYYPLYQVLEFNIDKIYEIMAAP